MLPVFKNFRLEYFSTESSNLIHIEQDLIGKLSLTKKYIPKLYNYMLHISAFRAFNIMYKLKHIFFNTSQQLGAFNIMYKLKQSKHNLFDQPSSSRAHANFTTKEIFFSTVIKYGNETEGHFNPQLKFLPFELKLILQILNVVLWIFDKFLPRIAACRYNNYRIYYEVKI